jgi:hypothetical protein
MPTSQELRDEADASERLASVMSYARDKEWLKDKAKALREQAERQERTSHRPRGSED